jgi:hypothetical protein
MRVTLRLESLDHRIAPSNAAPVTPYIVPSGHGGEVAHVVTLETGKPDGVEIFCGSRGTGVEV